MTERSPEEILAEWRRTEAALAADSTDPTDLARRSRIEELRQEYAESVAARDVEAHELGRPPHLIPPDPVR